MNSVEPPFEAPDVAAPDLEVLGLTLADGVSGWERAGFRVKQSTGERPRVRVDGVTIELGRTDRAIGWTLRGRGPDAVDGIPTQWLAADPEGSVQGVTHPNGVNAVDHLVVMTPALARTVQAFGAFGVLPRRERDAQFGGAAVRQVFFRMGRTIVEVVGDPKGRGEGPATLWGATFTVVDVATSAAMLAGMVSRVRDAVQPGRQICTVRVSELEISLAIALISPRNQG